MLQGTSAIPLLLASPHPIHTCHFLVSELQLTLPEAGYALFHGQPGSSTQEVQVFRSVLSLSAMMRNQQPTLEQTASKSPVAPHGLLLDEHLHNWQNLSHSPSHTHHHPLLEHRLTTLKTDPKQTIPSAIWHLKHPPSSL
jgi:hypothetical protein